MKFLAELPKVVDLLASYDFGLPFYIELGNLYAPGPGPSTFLGLK